MYPGTEQEGQEVPMMFNIADMKTGFCTRTFFDHSVRTINPDGDASKGRVLASMQAFHKDDVQISTLCECALVGTCEELRKLHPMSVWTASELVEMAKPSDICWGSPPPKQESLGAISLMQFALWPRRLHQRRRRSGTHLFASWWTCLPRGRACRPVILHRFGIRSRGSQISRMEP